MSFFRRTVVHYPFVSLRVFTGAVPCNDTVRTEALVVIVTGERPPLPTHKPVVDSDAILSRSRSSLASAGF